MKKAMPSDGMYAKLTSNKPKGVRMIRRHRSHTDDRDLSASALLNRGYDMDSDSAMPTESRARLYELFGQIEKEFETLYLQNATLQEKVETLRERLDVYPGADKSSSDIGQDIPDVGKGKRASQISQKIKTTYKGLTSTSKLVSSFRAPPPAYSMVREYRCHRDGVWEVSVLKPGHQVIGTASADHSACLWGIESGICLLQYLGHHGSVNSIRFHPTQDLVLTASGDQTVHIWKAQVTVPQNTEVAKLQSSGEEDMEGSEREDAPEDVDPALEPSTLKTPLTELTGHVGVVVAADWVTGGNHVITASWDRSAILYDAETSEQINTLTGHEQDLMDVRAHPTQRLVMTSSKDTTFRLWDLRDYSMRVSVFQGHTQPVTTAVFASGDKVVSGSDDRTVKVWDLKNLRSPLSTIRTDSAVNRLAVSSELNLMAIPHDNRHIRLYDITGNRVGRLPRNSRQGHSRMVCSVGWSDENPICNLFSCGFDRQVLGWHINPQTKE